MEVVADSAVADSAADVADGKAEAVVALKGAEVHSLVEAGPDQKCRQRPITRKRILRSRA